MALVDKELINGICKKHRQTMPNQYTSSFMDVKNDSVNCKDEKL